MITHLAESKLRQGEYVDLKLQPRASSRPHQRSSERVPVSLPGRLTWKDGRGATRFISVVMRNVSEHGVFIECEAPTAIPMYRLVHLQLERDARERTDIPEVLRDGKVLTAVYRVGRFRSQTGTPEGYGLRLMREPVRTPAEVTAREASRSIA